MKILIDQDEVLCHWSSRMVELWNEAHPDKRVEGVTKWDTFNFLGHPEATYFSRFHMARPEFWASLKPVAGALEGMKALHERGHDLRIATQVYPEVGGATYEGKLRWLDRNLAWFPRDKFFVLRHKDELRADILLDDAPHHLTAFEKVGLAVALDYPWNRDVLCRRVHSWMEFIEFVDLRTCPMCKGRRSILSSNESVCFTCELNVEKRSRPRSAR